MFDRIKADRIAGTLLDQLSRALSESRPDLFASCFTLPLKLDTAVGQRRFTTPQGIETLFNELNGRFQYGGVTLIDLNCICAKYRSSGEISFTYDIRLICEGTQLQNPIPVFSLLRPEGDSWRIAYCDFTSWQALRPPQVKAQVQTQTRPQVQARSPVQPYRSPR